ncbi:hypothetical protein CTA1_12157 [Colletotrichum tanaceti]|uniref:Uncharacterized protein n=1 Tax=Colletotrichum tanaceti TaxID=1306861 RepID=A0A4U6XR66_9PEZI|nr:hypothetical protein CTA1_12157 [Colletotrichum tanaceti]
MSLPCRHLRRQISYALHGWVTIGDEKFVEETSCVIMLNPNESPSRYDALFNNNCKMIWGLTIDMP